MKTNSIQILFPYRTNGIWAFNDKSVGLVREPFVGDINRMLDKLTADIPGAEDGFNLLFSHEPFPGYEVKLEWQREEFGGNWYWCEKYKIASWLCSAMYRYFSKAPEKLYAKAENKS